MRTLALTLLLAGPALAQSPAPDIIPPSLFTVPEGFEVTLWARSPMLSNPTNMDIDAQGRIWVTEGVNYRKHLGRAGSGDRVVVLSDTDGDGQADKTETFVQEPDLIAPMGIAVLDNKIVVSNAPDLIVYTDVDRDGKFDGRIDKREVLLTGFNGRNHDHSLHSVTVGPDGRWYFSQGNCGALFTDRSGKTFRIGSTYNPVNAIPLFGWKPMEIAGAKSDDGHVYVGGFTVRMEPDGTNASIVGHNYRNSFEQSVNSFGDVFQNDNDDPAACRTTFVLESGNTGFLSRDGRTTWKIDRRPGQTTAVAEWRQDDPHTIPAGDVYGGGAPTGIVTYEGDALGEKWRGVLLSCESGRNTVLGYFPKPEGAGYKLERFNFLTTNREQNFSGVDFKGGVKSLTRELRSFFRPSDVAVGPDGAIYVSDWFDPRVGGHDDFDDTKSGAIYRIAPKGFKSVVPRLDLATTAGQIAALRSPAINVRALGQARLRAQGAAVIAPVTALLQDLNPFVRARAVWLLAELGPAGFAQVESMLAHADAQLRVAAFRALRRKQHRVLAHAAKLARDPSPAVRREVALALRDVPISGARAILLALSEGYDGTDRSYLAAWGIGATGKEAALYDALAATQTEKDAAKWSPAYASLVWRLTPVAATGAFAARAIAANLSEPERVAAITALGFTATRDAAFAMLDVASKSAGQAKAHAQWWLFKNRHGRWQGMGVEDALKERGFLDPANHGITAAIVPPAAPPTLRPVAEIAALTGDARRGAGLAQSCLLCHRIGEQGIDYGPSLSGFASRQTTEVVVGAIVDPSRDISHGFDGMEIVLKNGVTIHGMVQSTGDPLVIQSTGGLTQVIPNAQIKSRTPMARSLMLSAEQLGLKEQDVADLVAYLKTQ
jgi:putative membrane-bound dehydrogenase-like protein